MHTYKVNTGLELSLERELADMTKERNDRAKRIVELRQEVRELQAQVKALCNQDEAQAEVARLKELLIEREDKWDEAKTNMALMTDELEKLRSLREASSGPCGCQAYRDLEEDRGRAEGEVELLQREIATLNDQVEELGKAYNDEIHETQVYKKAWREQRELVALRDEQIAMLERRLTMKNIDLSK